MGHTWRDGANLCLWQSFEPQYAVVYDPLETFLDNYADVKMEAGATFTVGQLSTTPDAQAIAVLSAFMIEV